MRRATARLVAAEVEQALVADAEMVGDLVPHDVLDLVAQQNRIGTVEPLERPAVDLDLVREDRLADSAAAFRALSEDPVGRRDVDAWRVVVSSGEE